MDIQEIASADTGQWVIVTLAGGVHVLTVPADGRATWTTTRRGHGAAAAPAEPCTVQELVAWGSYDVLAGMREGIAVGESIVLLTEPLGPDGVATALISSPVLSITDISGDVQVTGL